MLLFSKYSLAIFTTSTLVNRTFRFNTKLFYFAFLILLLNSYSNYTRCGILCSPYLIQGIFVKDFKEEPVVILFDGVEDAQQA